MHESIHAIHDNYFGHGGSRSVPEHFCTSGNSAGLPGPACKKRPAHIPFQIHPKCPRSSPSCCFSSEMHYVCVGWLLDKRVSHHRVWEEGAGLLRGGSGGFLPGGSFGCCSFPVELCLPVRLWNPINPINLLSSLLRSIPRLWLLQYH